MERSEFDFRKHYRSNSYRVLSLASWVLLVSAYFAERWRWQLIYAAIGMSLLAAVPVFAHLIRSGDYSRVDPKLGGRSAAIRLAAVVVLLSLAAWVLYYTAIRPE